MRLHSVRMTAFGPFAGTVEVDFDELGAAGLFLLTGATGAGKTSVLDAVCFGLYGEVPGDRGSARSLRSDHAAPDVEPRVELELSVGERRLRLSRSPAWDRPKRRGTGTRRLQASVVAQEWRDGAWTGVSTRLDETGHLVGELLGMTCMQFTQVAMLPQGRFQEFLRATSTDRHALLQRLFRTSRFDAVERWLAEQRQQARREAAAGHDACVSVLDRVCEAVGVELPADWEPQLPAGLGVVVDDGRLGGWADALRQEVADDEHRRRRGLALADERLEAARLAHEAAASTERLRARGREAAARLAACEAEADEVEAEEARLARHEAAVPLVPVARRAREAAADLQRARASADRARRRVVEALGWEEVGPERLHRARAEAERRHARAESWRPRERERDDARRALATSRRRAEHLGDRLDAATSAHATAGSDLDEATEARGALADVHDRLRRCAEEVASTTAGLAAAKEHEEVETRLRAAVARHQRLTDESQALKEHYLELREHRVAGMAAELAGGLAVGCSCPVCGSREHPAPASAARVVAAEEEDAARADHESAEVMRQAAGEAVSGLRSRVAALSAAAAGCDVPGWERHRHAALVAHEVATADRDRLHALDALLVDVREQRATAAAEVARLGAELTATQAETRELDDRATRLTDELTALLAGVTAPTPVTTVAGLVEALDAERRLLAEVAEVLRAESAAREAEAQATAVALESLGASGFDEVAACLDAVLDGHAVAAARERVASWRDRRRRAEEVAREADVVAALQQPEHDLLALQDAEREAREARDMHLADTRAAGARATRCRELLVALGKELEAWAPHRERAEALARLSALVDGTAPDNALRMRLSGYVLAERLRQVVDAANVRLASMTHERFSLRQADEKGAGERRGGLSLRVRDDWSGAERDPVTLSGGETFVVSLALALGLADVVGHETGGTTIETLFVDEGFGALDVVTLDAVMDVLDALRDGGRVVGLVSHVAELRDRVPAQLEVRLGRDGSTLGPVHLRA